MSGNIDGVGSINLGPIYQQQFNLADFDLANVYKSTFALPSKTEQLAPFTIGDTISTSLAVSTPDDSNTIGSGSLRVAVESANHLGGSQVIVLGPGTYHLTIPQDGHDDGNAGALLVTGNLTILGAGADKTIIDASGMDDQAFVVGSNAGLTVQGVTIEGGIASGANGGGIAGGGIYGLAASTIDIDHSVITKNTADQGGGVFADGNLTVTDSTISGNQTFASTNETVGGGIAAYGTTTISNSSIFDNAAVIGGLAALGGGIYSHGSLAINDSTIYNNQAGSPGTSGQGGGIYTDQAVASWVTLTPLWAETSTAPPTSMFPTTFTAPFPPRARITLLAPATV